MAILGFTGFETGDLSEAVATSGTVAASTSHPHSGSYSLRCNPTTSGLGAYRVGTYDASTGALTNPSFISGGQIYWRAYIYVATLPSSNDEEIFSEIATDGVTNQADYAIRLESTGALTLYSSATLIGTSVATLTTGVWHLLQFKWFMASPGGPYEILLDGASILSGTNTFGDTGTVQFWLGKNFNHNSQGYDVYFDDIAWSTTSYPQAGSGAVLLATGPGMLLQWSGSYTGVNSIPFSVSSPISTSSSNKKFDVALQTAESAGITTGSTINGVKVVAFAESSALNTVNSEVVISSNAYGTGGAALSGSYAPIGNFWSLNPNTGTPWSTSYLDSTQARVQSNSTGLVNCAGLYVFVDYSTAGFTGAFTLDSQPATLSFAGDIGQNGSFALQAQSAMLSLVGTETPPGFSGAFDLEAQPAALSFVGSLGQSGTFALQAQPATLSFVGTVTPPDFVGAFDLEAGPSALSFLGTETPPGFAGSFNLNAQAASLAFLGTYSSPGLVGAMALVAASSKLVFNGELTGPRSIGVGFLNFETGDLLEAVSTSGNVSISTLNPNSGKYSCQINPVNAATAYYQVGTFGPASDFCDLINAGFSANTPIFFRFYVFVSSLPPNGTPEEFFRVNDQFGNLIFGLLVDLDNLYIIGSSTPHSVIAPLSFGPHKIAFQFHSITLGEFSLIVDDQIILQGVDEFGSSALGNPYSVYLGKFQNRNGNGFNLYYDDLSWSIKSFPIDSKGANLVPVGAGGVSGWIGDYTNVNSVPPNQSTPLTSAIQGVSSDFLIENPTTAGIPENATINYVKVVATVKYSSGGFGSIVVGISIYGGGFFSSTTQISSSYLDYGQLITSNPKTGMPWTFTDLGALQSTITNETVSDNTINACALYIIVDYSVILHNITISVSPSSTIAETPTVLSVQSTGGTNWLTNTPSFVWGGGTVGTITVTSDSSCTVAVVPGSALGSFNFIDTLFSDNGASAIVSVVGFSAFGQILIAMQGMLAANAAFSQYTALITLWPEPFPQAGYPLAFIVPGSQKQIDAHVTGAGRYFAATEAEVTVRVIDHNLLDQSYQDIDRLTATTANAVGLLRTVHSAIDALNVRFAYASDGITPLTFEPLFLVVATRPRFYKNNTELAYVDLVFRVRYAFKITPIVPMPLPAMAMGPPPRTTLADLLLGIEALIVGGQVFTIGQTAISLYPDPFPQAGTPICMISPTDFRTFEPDFAGTGRYASTLQGSFVVTIIVRGNSDWAFIDYDRLLDDIYGIYAIQQSIIQALELAFPLDPLGNFLSEVPIRLVSIGQPRYFDQSKSWLGIEAVFSTKYNPLLTIELP